MRFAEARLDEYRRMENEARDKVAALMDDRSIAVSDKRIEEARKAVESSGSIREQLAVWTHEFRRVPEREYCLSLGDVVFFGIVDEA